MVRVNNGIGNAVLGLCPLDIQLFTNPVFVVSSVVLLSLRRMVDTTEE